MFERNRSCNHAKPLFSGHDCHGVLSTSFIQVYEFDTVSATMSLYSWYIFVVPKTIIHKLLKKK